ncbi:MAG: hypothetical protein IKU18_01200 [Bacteroidales bacterium]|nr:hypothetical protein [Bacteroidales bacterium]
MKTGLHYCTIKALLLAMLTLAATRMSGQENAPYFCNKANTTLEYTRSTAEGEIKWYHSMAIKEAHNNGDTTTINYTSYIENHKNKPYYGKQPAELTAAITKQGVTLNVAESVAAVFRTLFPGNTRITSTGGESALPSNMAPGDTLPDVYASVKVLGMTMKITVTQRQVLRFETIQTPAGSYNCIVIREQKSEKGMGRNRHTIADTWYSKGIGMVRHDTYNLKMELLTSEILTGIR